MLGRFPQKFRPDEKPGASRLNDVLEMLRPLSNPTGAGITQVTMTPDGTSIYTPEPPPPPLRGLFPVKVERAGTGNTNGTSSTPANYTYTVRRIEWTGSGTSADYELGTNVPQTRPRPNGPVTYQAGSTGYGVAFYDGGTLKLWDAGEIPQTVVGCT